MSYALGSNKNFKYEVHCCHSLHFAGSLLCKAGSSEFQNLRKNSKVILVVQNLTLVYHSRLTFVSPEERKFTRDWLHQSIICK